MLRTSVYVREVSASDEPSFHELVDRTLGECFGMVLSEYELTGCARTYHVRDGRHKYYVAEADGVLAGYAVVKADPDDTPPLGRIERLYVRHAQDDREYERAVAEALLSEIHADTSSADVTLALYDRWGFVDVHAIGLCLNSASGDGRWMAPA
jgi:hypothetical protein